MIHELTCLKIRQMCVSFNMKLSHPRFEPSTIQRKNRPLFSYAYLTCLSIMCGDMIHETACFNIGRVCVCEAEKVSKLGFEPSTIKTKNRPLSI